MPPVAPTAAFGTRFLACAFSWHNVSLLEMAMFSSLVYQPAQSAGFQYDLHVCCSSCFAVLIDGSQFNHFQPSELVPRAVVVRCLLP
jgi:hypothetical protein